MGRAAGQEDRVEQEPASHSPQTKCGHHRLLYLQYARVPVQFLTELLLHYRKF